jgi:hypothetical protein
MHKVALIVILTFLVALTTHADDRKSILGVWKLLTYDVEFQDGRVNKAPFGQNPSGYLIFTEEGRMMGLIEAEGRKAAKTDEERSNLLLSLIAYSGTYRLEADKWTTKVDVSWLPHLNGTEQVRYYKIKVDELEVIGAWDSTSAPGMTYRGVLRWQRVK